MTGEQETLVKNVDRLVEENESIKKRLSGIEGGGGLADIRNEIEGVRRSIAETNGSLESFRQEFAFVQGSVEEADHKRTQFKESIGAINSSLEAMSQRLSDMETRSAEERKTLEALRGSMAAAQAQLDALAESVASVDKRTIVIEEKAASVPAAAPAAQAKDGQAAPEPEAMYLSGYKETKDKNYPKATEIFVNFLSNYPRHKFAGNAQYWLGEIYYDKGDWEMAILEFDKAIKNYPDGEKVPASILKQGYAFEKLGSKKEARVLLERVIEKYPKSPEAGLAKKRIDALK
ncbi:MAG: tol-pal system protein YbgF [Deltaproteobacteria bacterium]|nr:tol-pal system protein YbgF [Deltaproteobacteria bacterium]